VALADQGHADDRVLIYRPDGPAVHAQRRTPRPREVPLPGWACWGGRPRGPWRPARA